MRAPFVPWVLVLVMLLAGCSGEPAEEAAEDVAAATAAEEVGVIPVPDGPSASRDAEREPLNLLTGCLDGDGNLVNVTAGPNPARTCARGQMQVSLGDYDRQVLWQDTCPAGEAFVGVDQQSGVICEPATPPTELVSPDGRYRITLGPDDNGELDGIRIFDTQVDQHDPVVRLDDGGLLVEDIPVAFADAAGHELVFDGGLQVQVQSLLLRSFTSLLLEAGEGLDVHAGHFITLEGDGTIVTPGGEAAGDDCRHVVRTGDGVDSVADPQSLGTGLRLSVCN